MNEKDQLETDILFEYMTQIVIDLCREYNDRGYTREEMWDILRITFEKHPMDKFKTFEEFKVFVEAILEKEKLK